MSDEKNWGIIEWAFNPSSDELKTFVETKKKAYPNLSPKDLAWKIVGTYSRKAGIEGFLTGLPSNVFCMAPASVIDLAYIIRCHASLSGIIGYLSNEKYFDDPDWKKDSYIVIPGPTYVSRALREVGITLTKTISKPLLRKLIDKSTMNIVKKILLKWFGMRVTRRAIFTKTVPFFGGIIGAGWNYLEMETFGKTIIEYHFEDKIQTEVNEKSDREENEKFQTSKEPETVINAETAAEAFSTN
ncbi:MAG: hypothetical protein HQM08_07885 [Candidatus Riflebacteria bacterium]|nr:hypothetical protein [Candidatus Riflebacteria bacterium]